MCRKKSFKIYSIILKIEDLKAFGSESSVRVGNMVG